MKPFLAYQVVLSLMYLFDVSTVNLTHAVFLPLTAIYVLSMLESYLNRWLFRKARKWLHR